MKGKILFILLAVLASAGLARFSDHSQAAGAQSAAASAAPSNVVRYDGSMQQPDTAVNLCRMSDTIVVGSVTELIRQGYSPQNSTSTAIPPHSVFSLTVEQSLRGSSTVGQTLKVLASGATLGGQTYVFMGAPLPQIGNRYLCFLRDRSAEGGTTAQDEVGVTGPVANSDELTMWYSGYGLVWLDSGIAKPAEAGSNTAEVVELTSGDQIVSLNGNTVTESESMTRTNAAIAEVIANPL